MRGAILDPFSGIAGDMTLGALIGVGLDAEWLKALPARLSLTDVAVDIRQVSRAGIMCWKVDFEIPPQPHGRHLKEIRRIVAESGAPATVRDKADAVFTAIATVEAEMHGVTVERVHLHEVGAVDAILDVVGVVWGLEELGVERVFCGSVRVGDGTVRAAHGELPVPAPATLKLLEGQRVRPGPDGAGELVTPTGAALVHVLSKGPPPGEFVPRRTGYGAGTKEFPDRANALRLTLVDFQSGDAGEAGLVEVVTDLDDMSPEYLAAAAERLRAGGALDVWIIPTVMKKGRAGVRLEVLCTPELASEMERLILRETTAIGLRRRRVERVALPREIEQVEISGHRIQVKVVTLPDGSRRRKPEFSDVERVALATGRSVLDIYHLTLASPER